MAVYRRYSRGGALDGGAVVTIVAPQNAQANVDGVNILFKDDYLIALDKPPGLLSVPGKSEPDCLEARVQAHFPDALTVHRLDMATSGVMVMERGKTAHANLQQQFEKRETRKTYISIVHGGIKQDAGTVDAPLRCDWPNRPRQIVCYTKGRHALTHWHVLERGRDQTRVMLTPITGRSHQLRVHMALIGHPIVGDPWYGGAKGIGATSRLMLHAERLTINHPDTKEPLTLVAPALF